MLRRRLILCLLVTVLVLWCTGAIALILMRSSVNRFESKFQRNIQTIDAAINLRTLSANLNSRYLPSLAAANPDMPPDREFYDVIKMQIREKQERIRSQESRDNRWQGAVARLNESLGLYLDGYDGFFNRKIVEADQRQAFLQLMASNTQQLTEVTNVMLAIAEGWLLMDAGRLGDDSDFNSIVVCLLILSGTIIAVLVYRELLKLLVDPITALERSLGEIRKGNFEMSLPLPPSRHDLAGFVDAFNQMASDLVKWRGQSDENLKRANIVNRAILEAIPSPVFVLGDDGRVIQMNPAAESLTESLGIQGRLPMKIQRKLDDCRANNSHYLPQDPKDALLFRINEEEHYFLPRIFHFESAEESLSGWALLLHNVSRIRWLDDMKTGLIATVGHEIRTPLTGIRMVLLMLLEERSGQLDKTQKMLITSASGDCERLLGTVNGLLDLAIAESGAIHLSRVPIGLKVHAENATLRFHDQAAEKSLVIRLEGTDNRFPKVLADPERLDEVLNNLLSNAITHSPEGSEIIVALSKPDAENIRLSVIDHGPGVPENSQGRIFERFYRAPGQKSQGLGLGLFISRDIMIAHEGRIGLLERNDGLTEFFIDVPIA
jgi:two-component system, NtrC family, sensor histidine kinase KinB